MYSEFELNGNVTVSNFLQWNYSLTNILGIISELLKTLTEVEITEYWGSTFQLKIDRNRNEDKISIGYLFGAFNEFQEKFNISEYSISQTSMEQIFNNLANKDDFGQSKLDKDDLVKQNHKPKITVNNDYIKKVFI